MAIARTAFLVLLAFYLTSYGQEPRLTPRVSVQHPILATSSLAPDFSLPGIDQAFVSRMDLQLL
jgi:hypothetical protein